MRLTDVLLKRRRSESEEEGLEEQSWKEEVETIAIHLITPSKFQPRREFAEEPLTELAESIEVHGLLHPIVVRKANIGYEIIVGERRLRACKRLGWESIPAIVKDVDDKAAAELALIENLQRADLNIFELAEGYERLLREFGLTQNELGKRLGISQANIANKIRLLKLPESVREIISREMLSERHARSLLQVEEEEDQLEVLKTVVGEELNVKETEAVIRGLERRKRRGSRPGKGGAKKLVFKDIRLFTNSVRQLVRSLETSGLEVEMDEKEDELAYEIVVIVRKPQAGEENG